MTGIGVGVGVGRGVAVAVGVEGLSKGMAGLPCSSVKPGIMQLRHSKMMVKRTRCRFAMTGFIIEDG